MTIDTGPMAQRHVFRCCGWIEREGSESQTAEKILNVTGRVHVIYFNTGARYLGDLQISTTNTQNGVVTNGRPHGKGCYFDPRSKMYYAGGFRHGRFDGWGARGWLFGASRMRVEIGQFRRGRPIDVNFLHDNGTHINGYRFNQTQNHTPALFVEASLLGMPQSKLPP